MERISPYRNFLENYNILKPYKDRLSNLKRTTLIDMIKTFKIFCNLCTYGENLLKFPKLSSSGMNIV